MRPFISSLALAFSLIFTVGCSDTPTENTPVQQTEVPTGTVTGTVTNPAGSPLAGVNVVSGTETTTTNENGVYSLTLLTDTNTSITADLLNHAQNSRVVTVTSDATTTLDMTLVVVDTIEVFNAADGILVSIKGASVDLPSNAYVLADGTVYSAEVTVKVSYNRVTTVNGEEAFPGAFIGLEDNGSTTGIRSYGFIDVTLHDSEGNPLQLADGAEATLTFPMDRNIDETPATIPLWYYDTEKGIWVEDGVAAYDVDTNTYSGAVTHFTTWNLDAKFNGAAIEGCVEDINGLRVPVADIYVSTPGWNKHVTNRDANGAFKFINAPSDLNMSIRAVLNDTMSAVQNFTLAAGETKTFENCLQLDTDASTLFTSVTGQLTYSDESPIVNQYVYLYSGDTYLGNTRTDVNGTFMSTPFLRPQIRNIEIRFSLSLSGEWTEFKKGYKLHPVHSLTDVGTIVIASTHVSGCVSRVDGNTTFENSNNTINIDTPYDWDNTSFSNNGLFDIYLEKDYAQHSIYAKVVDYGERISAPQRVSALEPTGSDLYGSQVFSATADFIDLTAECVIVEEAVDINTSVTASITSSDGDVYLNVIYNSNANYDYPNTYGDETLLGGEECFHNGVEWVCETLPTEMSGTFDLTKNGIYYVSQKTDIWEYRGFNGTISITIDTKTYTLTIPTEAEAYEAWMGFAIEVFQGEIKVIELNQESNNGE